VLTLFLTFDLVLFGAFTRLTDSGLGCPDWPGCYGNASPTGALPRDPRRGGRACRPAR
jgi:cytochrome c oxidase assembly protein subunit 15